MTKKDTEKKQLPPLENPVVHVDATPKKNKNAGGYARKIDDSLKKDIQDALIKRKKKGAASQIKAAQKAVDAASEAIDDNLIEKVDVRVGGVVNGKRVEEDMEFVPGVPRDTSNDEQDDDDDDDTGNDDDDDEQDP